MEVRKIKLLKEIIHSNSFLNAEFNQYKKFFTNKDFALMRKERLLRSIVIDCFNQTRQAEAVQKTKFKDVVHIGGSGGDS